MVIIVNKFLAFFGHLNIDVKISVPKLPGPGEAMGVKKVSESFAGTAGNFAIVASSLGLNFDLYSAVGSITHKEYINFLQSKNIGTEFIHLDKNEMGPVCYLPSDGKEQISYMYQGPMDIWKASFNFKNNYYDYINLGTGPVNEYIKIVENNKTSRIVFDPGQEIWYTHSRESLNKIIPNSYIIILNRKEFLHMLELSGMEVNEILKNTVYIIVTEGSDGAFIYNKNGIKHIEAVKTEKIFDTVGAGDAFRAGFYTALYNSYSIENAVKIGNKTASRAIEKDIRKFNYNFADIIKNDI